MVLQKIRETIQKAAPLSADAINYGIPIFVLNGNLVHFARYKHHYGFNLGAAIITFKKELTVYNLSKGTFQFAIDKPVPFSLIVKIVKFRVLDNKNKK
jgi:uncharacterized protein YdhG (YjbR/CyaY superfamily)